MRPGVVEVRSGPVREALGDGGAQTIVVGYCASLVGGDGSVVWNGWIGIEARHARIDAEFIKGVWPGVAIGYVNAVIADVVYSQHNGITQFPLHLEVPLLELGRVQSPLDSIERGSREYRSQRCQLLRDLSVGLAKAEGVRRRLPNSSATRRTGIKNRDARRRTDAN